MKLMIAVLIAATWGCGDNEISKKNTPENNVSDMSDTDLNDSDMSGDGTEDQDVPPEILNLPASVSAHWADENTFEISFEDVNEPAEELTVEVANSTCAFDVRVETSGIARFTCGPNLGPCEVDFSISNGLEATEGTLTIHCTNTAPSVSNVHVSSENPSPGTELTCEYMFEDADNDPDDSQIAWMVGTTMVATGATFSDYQAGDEITCGVTPGDGAATGSRKWSDPVTSQHASIQLAAGQGHTCAWSTGGPVKCWGRNEYGQLGVTTNMGTELPTAPVLAPVSEVDKVVTLTFSTCALKDGDVMCWGRGQLGQLGATVNTYSSTPVTVLSGGVTDLAAGVSHVCAIQNGGLKCWGSNASGQLGSSLNNVTGGFIDTPVAVPGLTSSVSAVSAGQSHTCAIRNGRLKCFGFNYSGQLGVTTGQGSFGAQPTPVEPQGMGSNVTAIALGSSHSCAVQSQIVKCWGLNFTNQLGRNTTVDWDALPTAVTAITGSFDLLTSGAGSNICYTQNDELKCWGNNAYGQLLTSGSSFYNSVNLLTARVTAIGVGFNHICAVQDDEILCWGHSTGGRLGDGTDGPISERNGPLVVPY